ncbi:MAG: hypothetical protein ACRC0V_08535, partial [Fusobacteriaceae bacterium]
NLERWIAFEVGNIYKKFYGKSLEEFKFLININFLINQNYKEEQIIFIGDEIKAREWYEKNKNCDG